jgi:lysylphosphatidylglycerol synthetase-like protein (DUF2156 family)
MSKSFLFKLLLILSLAAAAVLWILSVALPDTFGGLPIGMWAIVIVAGGWGVTFVLRALFSKTSALPVTLKRLWVIMGFVLIVIAVLTLVNIFAWDNKLILPIIAIAGVAALLIMLFATGGKKWDEGDNKKVGYEDYRTRKARQEREEAAARERENEDNG